MFHRWRIARRNRAIVEELYQNLVAQTRQPALYERCGIADTFSGRFEALAIHVFLFLRRCRGEARLEPIAQEVVDRFVTDVDTSIRELGVGDQSVPKRMRKLAGVFYERVHVYDAAFAADDPAAALAVALKGRALDEASPADAAASLATYMQDQNERLGTVSADDILSGTLKIGD